MRKPPEYPGEQSDSGPGRSGFVGGGPRTVSLLEQIAANAPELLPDSGLQIHVVDPYPVGGGLIWRRNQSPQLWMNSVARDVTILADESVVCRGPILPGPAESAFTAAALAVGLTCHIGQLLPSCTRTVVDLPMCWCR